MKIENNFSPEQSKLVVIGSGVALAFFLWTFLDGRFNELRYQEVYGEVVEAETPAQEVGKLEALPLVEIVGTHNKIGTAELNEMAIEAAFREPVFNPIQQSIEEEVAEEKPVVSGPTLAEQFLIRYRPLVGGVSDNGVVISGEFWLFGDSLATMPMADTNSGSDSVDLIYPKLVGVRKGTVILMLGDQEIPIEFDRI